MSYLVYHNPRCRKSREALKILEEKGIEPEVHEYLKEPLSAAELKKLSGLLGLAPEEFMRTGEKEYKEYVKGRNLNEKQLFEMMEEFPILMERPIVVKDRKQAVVGRPPERVLELVEGK